MKRNSLHAILAIGAILALTTTSAHAAVIAGDLITLYDFNGNANDSSGNGYNASLVGGAAISADGAGYSSSPGDYSLNLGSGTGQYANVTGATNLGSATANNEVAVSYWQYNTGNGSGGNINNSAFRVVGSSNARGVQTHSPWSNGTLYFDHAGCCGGSQRLTTGVGNSMIDGWHHVVVQIAGGAKQIWVDGTLLANQASGAAAVPGLTGQLLIGADLDGNWFRGRLDEFAVWSGPLSQSQIASLYSGTSTANLIVGPQPEQIMGVTATASSELTGSNFNRVVGNIVDNIQLTTTVPDGTPGVADGGMWLNNGTYASPNDTEPWVTFDLGAVERIGEMQVFNYNESANNNFARGVKDLEILVSNDNFATDIRSLGAFEFDIANGLISLDGQIFDLGGVEAQYVMFDILSNHGGDNSFVGLNEVQFFRAPAPVPEPSTFILATFALLGLGWYGRRRRG